MKVGLLSDIHGNDLALEATLTEARKLGVQRLLVLGDLVGYYYRIPRVLELLNDWHCDLIQGNHEAMLTKVRMAPEAGGEIRRKYGQALDLAISRLNSSQLARLESLPTRLRVEIEGSAIELCHGSPWDQDSYVYPDAKPEVLRQCAVPNSDLVLLGHTHRPFSARIDRTLLCNPGSVGQSRVRGGLANWAIFDTSNGVVIPQVTPYDPTELIEEVLRWDPDVPYLHQILQRT